MTWLLQQRAVEPQEGPALQALLADLELRFGPASGAEQTLLVNGVDATTAIRTAEVTASVSAVAALPSVHERVPEATLLLLGKATTSEGERNMAALQRMAEEVGDPAMLRSMGLVDHTEVPRVLASCDLCVAPFNPSGEPELLKYGFWYSPTKLWEYMAAGKPVVATDLDNIRDIVGDDRGILVPPGDPDALADALVKVLTDEDLRRRMGESSLAFARENTWEKRVDEYERAIVETLEGGK